LFDNLSIDSPILDCNSLNSNTSNNLVCEFKIDEYGFNYIMVTNASIITLSNIESEDSTKSIKFSIAGMKTTNLSGVIDIT